MMQLKYFLSFILISVSLFAQQKIDKETCSYNGIQLYGKVKVVEHFPDITIQVVESFADIDVKVVEEFADECGEWKMVEKFPDFTIKIVEHNADIKVRFVRNFPKVKN